MEPVTEAMLRLRLLECAEWVRDHWLVENQLHWILDVAFTEDACRVRKGYGTENFAWLRRVAVRRLRAPTLKKRCRPIPMSLIIALIWR